MSKRSDANDRPDLLTQHQEWVDHMDNPHYWINRISYQNRAHWRWMRKHHRLSGGVLFVVSGLGLSATMFGVVSEAQMSNVSLWLYLRVYIFDDTLSIIGTAAGAIIFLFILIISMVLFFQKTQSQVRRY